MTVAQKQIVPLTEERSAVRIVGTAVNLLFGASAAVHLYAFAAGASSFPRAHLVAVALSLYLLLEAQLYLRRSDALGLLSPAFLSLPFHFFLAYLGGITGAVFEPRIIDRFAYWLPDLDKALAHTMLMAMLAAFCMIRGYVLARPMSRRVRRTAGHLPYMRHDIRPAFGLVIAMQFAYIVLVAYAIDVGAYGLLSTIDSRARLADIQQFLNLALAAGTLSYFLILLRYFQRRAEGRAGSLAAVLVGAMIAVHVFTGMLSAFKSQIVFPFVIAGFAYFLATRRIPVRFVGFAVVALIVAYAVIEPFRSYMGLRGEPPQSVVEAVEAIGTALELREQLAHTSDMSRPEAIAQRFDLAGMTALAIDFVDRGDLQPDKRQEFQDSILLAPILAFIPRAFWKSKPSFSPGAWFNQNVRGSWEDDTTSVGMGPIGFLYMTGGTAAVMLGFFGFGMLQALIFEGFARAGAGGLIIFLAVAGTLVTIPSSFGPAVVGVLRMLPVAFVAQMILLRRTRVPGLQGL